MTRLADHRKKEMTQKASSLFIVFIVVSILLFTFGFKLVIQASVIISNLLSKESTANQKAAEEDQDFFGTIDLDTLPTATNSAKLIVSGTTSDFDEVEIYINSEKVKESKTATNNEFSEEVGDLQKGDNEIYVRAIARKAKKTKSSDTYTVIYISDKPKLEVSEPGDNSTVNRQEVKVVGTTDKGNTVSVNNLPVVVDINGKFQTTTRLKDGENKIEIHVNDIAGNEEKKTLTVQYKKDE